jgi:hypothetical protein
MKKLMTICLIVFIGQLYAQKKSDYDPNVSNWRFAIAPTVGVHFNIYNKGLNNLNTLLEQHNIPQLIPALNAIGLAFVVKNNMNTSFIEISAIENTVWERKLREQDWLVPKIKGINFRGILTTKILEKRQLRLDGGFGFSISKYSFRLVDRRSVQSPFDSLLNRPTQSSASLDYTQKSYNYNIDGRFGITYDTKWAKKVCEAYEFSLFFNYSQTLYNSKKWVVTDTNVPIKNFSTINFSNFYVQFVISIYLKYKN